MILNFEEYKKLPCWLTDRIMTHFDNSGSLAPIAKNYGISKRNVKKILLFKLREHVEIERIRQEFSFEF